MTEGESLPLIADAVRAGRGPSVDEQQLASGVRDRLSEIRACNNVQSLTPLALIDAGLLCLLVPRDHVGGDANWGMPTEPHLLTIPTARLAN